MQTVIGRLVSDATVNETKDGRKVVNFTIAMNDRFKVKGLDELKQVTNYFQCSFWMGAGIAQHMKRGMLIETAGRIGVSTWQNASGETKAALTLHVQFIQLHGKTVKVAEETTAQTAATAEAKSDDLPF